MDVIRSLLVVFILAFFLFDSHECQRVAKVLPKQQPSSYGYTAGYKNTNKEKRFEGDIIVRKDPQGGARSPAVFQERVWPEAKIPYVISNEYDQNEKKIILDAIYAFHGKTCVRFNPRKNEADFVIISKANRGCSSYVGRQGGNQTVSLDDGCVTPTSVKHELMHAIGFYHEHSRRDRDNFVIINRDNIQRGQGGNFNKYDSRATQLLRTPYDIKSIMHYWWNAFALDPRRPTITARNSGAKIEPSDDFTQTDLLEINRMYNCKNAYDSNPVSKLNWKDGDDNQFKWASNCDFLGSDYRSVKSKADDCGRLCMADLKCTHFTHWADNGYCYLKSVPNDKVPDVRQHKGRVCGFITRRNFDFHWETANNGEVNWARGCDFFGNDIRSVKSRGEECAGLCVYEPKCTHFSWGNGGYCYLKSDKNPVASAVTSDAICGLVRPRVETTDDSLGLLGTPFSVVNCRTGFIMVNGQCVRGTAGPPQARR